VKGKYIMKTFIHYAPTEIVFGCGKVQEIGSIASRYGKKALLVTVPEFPAVKELYAKVKESLVKSGLEVVHFDGVIPNPTTDVVTEGANMAKASGVDVVIGLGGGSSMDTAKAIAVEATHPGTAWDYNCHTPGPTEATLPIIAIGTTAGTGSQCTQCAVITKTSDKDKSAIWHRNIFPKVAIVDPEVTVTMPKSVTAQTGFDAFCHNFEAYLSVNTNPLVEIMAEEAIKIIKEYLPKALENPDDIEARSKMAWADTLGGLTNSNAGVTLPHGLGMQVGGHAPHVSHGQALAIIYPQFTRYTYLWAIEKFAKVGRILNPDLEKLSDQEAAKESCRAIDDFLKKLDLWIGFKDVNVTKDEIRQIAVHGQVLGDYLNNPRVATIDEMYEILMNCYERKE
jgi:alcohol dehydrogenase class IV